MQESFPSAPRPRQRLLLFARLPEEGEVKTRLAREIGSAKALNVYRAMLADLLDSIGPSDEEMVVEVAWTASADVPGAVLRETFGRHELARQCGSSLGDRLTVAFSERILFHLAEKVIAIGADEPSLTRHDIAIAFRLLDSFDWVVGPTHDGGYYLIGCRGQSFHPSVFHGIAWGTDSVLDSTLERIRSRLASVAILPCRTDIDVERDLRSFALAADGRLADVLRQWGWIE